MKEQKTLAIVVTHPIQHFVPFFKALAKEPSLRIKVFFASNKGATAYHDRDFGATFKWSGNLLEGYEHTFLRGADGKENLTFWRVNNPIRKELLNFAPDIVLTYGYAHLLTLKTLAICRMKRIPVITISDSELIQRRSRWKVWSRRLILPPLFRQISGFLSVGDACDDYYKHFRVPGQKLFRSPFTIDEQSFLDAREQKDMIKDEFRRSSGIPCDAVVILFVGKLTPRKRPADIIHALRYCSSRIEDRTTVVAVMAGNGILRNDLQQLVDELGDLPNCSGKLLGFVNLEKLPAVYAASDILVHPSEKDPHPLATVEAAFMGMPIIVSDRVGSAGPTDTVRHGINGFVYPCGDTTGLAETLLRLVNNSSLRSKMGQESLRIAAEMDMSASIQGLLQAVNFCCPQSDVTLMPSMTAE